jgi:ADP-heptose:LPS heptosyltransferase
MYPSCQIIVLARSYVEGAVKAHPAVDLFIDSQSLEKQPESESIKQLQSLKADIIIHAFPNKNIAFLAKKAGIPTRIGTARRWFHWLTCNKKTWFSRKQSSKHEANLNLQMLQVLGFNQPYEMTDLIQWAKLDSPPLLQGPAREWLSQDKFNVIIHPGTNGNTLEWPIESFKKLIELLPKDQFNILLTGSPAERDKFAELELEGTQNTMGQLSLSELISLIGQADGLIANSTGPLHLAAALGTHTLGLFPSHPGKSPNRWAPLGEKAEFIAAPLCQACLTHKGNCSCMKAITPEHVAKVLNQWQNTTYLF